MTRTSASWAAPTSAGSTSRPAWSTRSRSTSCRSCSAPAPGCSSDLHKGHLGLEPVETLATPSATHLRYRIADVGKGSAMTNDELAAHARAIIDANLYLTLGTVDADGHPWTTPVYFAPAGDREFIWVSATDARHSRHIAERPRVSLVIFDSTVAPYHGRAVYAVGEARGAVGRRPRPRAGVLSAARRSGRHAGDAGGRDRAGAVPPLPGDGVGHVGAVSAGAPAAVPAPRPRQGPPDPRTAGLTSIPPTTSFVLTIELSVEWLAHVRRGGDRGPGCGRGLAGPDAGPAAGRAGRARRRRRCWPTGSGWPGRR